MYLYLTFDDTNSSWVSVGLLPSSRGRPAKNHMGHEFVTDSGLEFAHQFACVSAAEVTDAEKAAQLKQMVVTSARDTENAKLIGHLGPNNLTFLLADAVKETIKGLLASTHAATMPGSMSLQLTAVKEELEKLLLTGTSLDDSIHDIKEILAHNKKLLNVAMNTLNADWFRRNGLTTDTDPEAGPPGGDKPTRKKKEAEATEDSAEVREPVASAFGFERLSGEKPELKVVAENETQAEVHGVFMPKPDSTYIINDNTESLFRILQVSRKHAPQNVNLIGPHGCGKTELAIQFAARCNVPMLIMDCANLREARDWFGFKTAREGTVYWHESQFVRAVEAGNHVILLDELNRANPHILNTLMPLLDGRRFTFLEEKGDKICVGPGTVFFATMNEGAGYTGTASLDRAFRDRFPRVVELTYLGEKDEINLLVNRVGIDKGIAKLLVEMANKIRQDSTGLAASLTESISTRQLLAAAADFAIGGVETLQFTISNHFSPDGDDDSERVKVQNIIQGKFGHMLAATAAKKGA